MHPLTERVRRTIRRHSLVPAGSRVLVALSGGADSVALTWVMRELAAPLGFDLVALAHLNHQLRGEAADGDEAFCRALADRLAIPFAVERIAVDALAHARHASLEETGRAARYAFLARAAEQFSADRIAVGHTRDDQAETFLLRLLRGAGPQGLAGIHPRFGSIVRPLIDVTHDNLLRYLSECGEAHREDATNDDVAILRNRVRHRLIPMLAAEFSPDVVDVLAREAAIARDDAAWLNEAALEAAARIIKAREHEAVIDIPSLLGLPPALARRVLLHTLGLGAGGRGVHFQHAEALLALAAGHDEPGPVDLPGQRAFRIGRQLVLRSHQSGRATSRPGMNAFRYLLPVPGEALVAEAACALSADPAPPPTGFSVSEWASRAGPDLAVVDAGQVAGSLGVRNRRAGDRFRPLGLAGHKKLQDFFVDRKVPRSERDRVPLVVDGRDRIVWVAGHAIDAEFRVTDRTKSVVILRLKDLGASR